MGSKFLGPVMIEVPHFASLRRGERETSILRCECAVKGKWEEHKQSALAEKALKVSPEREREMSKKAENDLLSKS